MLGLVIEKEVPSNLLDCYCLIRECMPLLIWPLAGHSIENGAINIGRSLIVQQNA